MSRDRFGHGPRVSAAGSFRTLGEALSIHFGHAPKAAATVRRWLASPGHRSVLLKSNANWMGAGLTQGRFRGRKATIWVLQIGRR